MGHAAGDRLLEICGERLRHAVRVSDTVARLGGDEFAVLAIGADHPDALVERLFGVLAAPLMLEMGRVRIEGQGRMRLAEQEAEAMMQAAGLQLTDDPSGFDAPAPSAEPPRRRKAR